jgi:hypothetical protein
VVGVAEVIVLAEVVRARRQRSARALHAVCRGIIATGIARARSELVVAPREEWPVRVRRLRKLEELAAYAAGIA